VGGCCHKVWNHLKVFSQPFIQNSRHEKTKIKIDKSAIKMLKENDFHKNCAHKSLSAQKNQKLTQEQNFDSFTTALFIIYG
jgi:hypothetical protein